MWLGSMYDCMYLWNGGWIDFSPLCDVSSGCTYEKLSKHCSSSLNLHFCLYRSSVRLTSNTLSRLLSILSVVSLCDKGARRFRPESLCRRPLIAPFRPMDAVQHNRDSVINTCFSSVEAYSLSTSITRLIWLLLMQLQTSQNAFCLT